ncbi:DUF2255 family protein [Cellulomonas rhizosphaerae]|uniref:DUF2255 family protein n=1 Tax=Cellulomonas rhizosphaerae TaxID=2293719 RepID=A0A413RLF3_9CELL|nr:DUF2255 family protein [Cellulomonas rhizosphaerae]RHA40759.1 DUF2255 family protein [Cellulomonas rhizosphaerae]
MSAWTAADLARVDEADELRISSYRPDGTLRPGVTIWAARVGDDVYVRSAQGPGNGWFRRAVAAGRGHVSVGGVETDVDFATPDDAVHADLDAAYHAKYDRYGPGPVGAVTGPTVPAVTLRLDPR